METRSQIRKRNSTDTSASVEVLVYDRTGPIKLPRKFIKRCSYLFFKKDRRVHCHWTESGIKRFYADYLAKEMHTSKDTMQTIVDL